MNTPPLDNVLLHIPDVSDTTEPFSSSRYDVIDGTASAEQLMLIVSPLHALLLAADVSNWTFSGGTAKKYIHVSIT